MFRLSWRRLFIFVLLLSSQAHAISQSCTPATPLTVQLSSGFFEKMPGAAFFPDLPVVVEQIILEQSADGAQYYYVDVTDVSGKSISMTIDWLTPDSQRHVLASGQSCEYTAP